jgi:hypothetical protein
MNRKTLTILLVLAIAIGGIGLAMFRQDTGSWQAQDGKIGQKLLPALQINDVAQVYLKSAKGELTLVLGDGFWTIKERGGYPADTQAIAEFLIKLRETKIGQSERITEKQRARVEVAEPGTAEGGGTLVELRDKAGKPLVGLIMGKKHLGKPPVNVVGFDKGQPDGRFLIVAGKADTVITASDPFNNAEVDVEKWIDKGYVKIDRIRTMKVVAPEADRSWEISRSEEFGDWKLAGLKGAEKTSAGAASTFSGALGSLAFKDVAIGVKPDALANPTIITAETFDGWSYAVKVAKKPDSEDFLVNIVMKGEPPKERVPEKGEKPEDKEKLEKQFAERKQRIELQLVREKAMANWVHVLGKDSFAKILRPRADLIEKPRGKDDDKGGPPPGFPPGMMPGMMPGR